MHILLTHRHIYVPLQVCTIILSVIILGESMSVLNVVGMVVTIGGIVLYNVIKYYQNFHDKEVHGPGEDGHDYAKLHEEMEDEGADHIEMTNTHTNNRDTLQTNLNRPPSNKSTSSGGRSNGSSPAENYSRVDLDDMDTWELDDENDERGSTV